MSDAPERADDCSVASARVTVERSRSECWARLEDLLQAHRYVPGIVRTELTTSRTRGVGASRRVYQRSGKGLDETVEQWSEGEGFLIRLHRGDRGAPPPFRQAWFRYAIVNGDERQTTLELQLIYRMRWGAAAKLLGALLAPAFRRTVGDVAAGLRRYYEARPPLDEAGAA